MTFNRDLDLETTCLVWTLHIVTLSQQFDLSLMNIRPRVIKIWRGHEIQGSNWWLVSSTEVLSLRADPDFQGFCHLIL